MKRKPYPNNPMFSSKSLLYQCFSMAMKGTTIDKLHRFCRSIGSDGAPYIIRIIRSCRHKEKHREIIWSLEEKNGKLKVKDIQTQSRNRK